MHVYMYIITEDASLCVLFTHVHIFSTDFGAIVKTCCKYANRGHDQRFHLQAYVFFAEKYDKTEGRYDVMKNPMQLHA